MWNKTNVYYYRIHLNILFCSINMSIMCSSQLTAVTAIIQQITSKSDTQTVE